MLFIKLQFDKKYNQKYSTTMAPRRKKIDLEWAYSLVGLPVKIPDNWWVGYTGSYLHDGRKVSFDICKENKALVADKILSMAKLLY